MLIFVAINGIDDKKVFFLITSFDRQIFLSHLDS